jgi:nitroreductase/NAD-dependent dihydropyrimidine dehydrogenase PreA subunit
MISVDGEKCTGCLECVSVCPNYVLAAAPAEGEQTAQVRYAEQCCACGHCIAVCPNDALAHPDLPGNEFQSLPESDITPEAMQSLLLSRRSIRNYQPHRVPEDKIALLMAAAAHAGTASNGQTEGFILVEDQVLLGRLEGIVIEVLWNAGLKYLGGDGPMTQVLKWKYGAELVRQYRAYHGIFRHRREHGELAGAIFRKAPLVIVAHGLRTNVLAAANCALAIRNIELLALTMGLGTCWAGFLVVAAGMSKLIGRLLGIPKNRRICGALLVGYPQERYGRAVPRQPRTVTWFRPTSGDRA